MKEPNPPVTFAGSGDEQIPAADAMRRLTSEYRPWRKLRYIAADLGVDPLAAWKMVKQRRSHTWSTIPVRQADGRLFGLTRPAELIRRLFVIDRASGDDLLTVAGQESSSAAMRKRLDALFRGGEIIPVRLRTVTRMFEAAESSIIEGASATREIAVDLLRSGRSPRTIDEKMIFNNYQAMEFLKRRTGDPLSVELLLELHAVLTEGTLPDDTAAGRFRTPLESVQVVDTRDDSTIFIPPAAERVREMLGEVCAFANRQENAEEFVHPIVKACILHFLLGYVHPFVDGNGRTARAVFYWFALRHGYGIFEYLSISEIIRTGFARYPQAYLDTETDEGDLTYFILYKLDIIERSLEALAGHTRQEEERLRRSEALAALNGSLNLRQRLVLEHAIRHPEQQYTVKSHAATNGTTLLTARTDLESLSDQGFMRSFKVRNAVHYVLDPRVTKRLARVSKSSR